MLTEFVYTWPDGRQEVRYRRVSGDECDGMMEQVDNMRLQLRDKCPYSYRPAPAGMVDESTADQPEGNP